jgi:ATP-dependent helicase/nuclease subunit A
MTVPAPARPAYRVDHREVPPAAFYAAACDPRRSAVVEACAGAGKTWMLVSRILRALLDGAEPSQILAITFTRKAAGEMRERLDQWLRDFAAPACDDARRVEALQARGLSETQARAAAPAFGALYERLLRDGRGVQVQTFHGWFAQLLAGAPVAALEQLGLAPGLQLLEDPWPLRPALMQAFHAAVDADAGLRDDYLALVQRHRRSTVVDWLDAAWMRRPEVELADRAGTLADAVPPPSEDPMAAMDEPAWRAALQALAAALAARGKVRSTEAAERLGQALEATDPRLAFARAWEALMTGQGTPRKQLGDLPAQAEATGVLERLQAAWRQRDAHEDHGRMTRLARVLLRAYAALKRQRGLADMGDLEQVGQALLGDAELAGWVQTRLDLRLRHLLIDEFQDTSPLQWLALRQWLEAYAGAGGGASGQRPLSVFLVGDPKQSIYRFRRAEPRVFAAAADFVVAALDGRRLACDHTRRNAPEVLAVMNTVFDEASRRDGWGGFRTHTTDAPGGGSAWQIPVPAAADDDGRAEAGPGTWRDALSVPRDPPQAHRSWAELQAVAAVIASELAAGRWTAGEVMVLARRRAALGRLSEALALAGVPCTEPEALSLATAPEAQDLVALLDVLCSPGHDLSLARALKSPLFGASDADLLGLAQLADRAARAAQAEGGPAEVRSVDWWTVLVDAEPAPSGLSPALQRARELLRRWADAAVRLPPHDLLDRIVHEGELPARLAAALPPARRRAGLQAVDALLEAALRLDGGRYATPYAFVRALRQRGADVRVPAPPDAVRLLTVHGAKGLEAEVVIVIEADPEARKPERATLLIDWPPEAAAPARVAFVARESAPAPSLEPLLADEQAARAREELNGLYVAMTRARRHLLFSRTPARSSDPDGWWLRLADRLPAWPHAGAAPPTPAAPAAAAATVSVPVLVAAPPDGHRWAGDASAGGGPVASGGAAARLGRAVHRLLEWAGQPGRVLPRDRWPAAAAVAARQAGLPGAGDEVLAIGVRVIDSPDCLRFFDPRRLRWAGNEVPLDHAGQALRLDRLVLLDDDDGVRRWWVLDYKLSGQPLDDPALRDQLARYRDAVAALQPGEPVAAAFITGQGRWVPLQGPGNTEL